MRPVPVAIAALILTGMAGAANAATTPAAPVPAAPAASPPPRFLQGLSHPDLTACQTMNASQRVCIVPAGVGGSYVVEAAGFATSTGADTVMALDIIVGRRICITQTGAKFTGRGYLHAVCELTLATDTPLQIVVNVQARNGTLDAQGPRVLIHNVPWDGVVSIRGGDGGPLAGAAPPAPAKPASAAKPSH